MLTVERDSACHSPAAHPWGHATILSVKMLPIKLNNCHERVFNKFCVFAICNANKCARFEYPKYCHEYRIICISTNEYISYICAVARIHFQIDSTDYTRITRSTWFAANPQLLRLIQSAKYAMKICQRKRIPEHIQKIRGASSPEIELDPQQLRWKVLYIFYIFFSFHLINTFPWWIQCVAGKVDAVKISTARIFYCSHFSINLITRRFVIIGAWKNKFNFFFSSSGDSA